MVSDSLFEQGTIAESVPVGNSYESTKYPPTEPLHGSRVRLANLIPITEFSTISIGEGYQYCTIAFDANQKYIGQSSYQSWSDAPRLTYPNAEYLGIAVKKVGTNIPIVPSDVAGAWSNWSRIRSPLPMDANEGDHLRFRGGKWVAEAGA